MDKHTVEDEHVRRVIQSTMEIFMNAALNLIQADPHQWSERPCSTCRAVSELANKPFGCCAYAKKREETRK